jgi:hypothetical protein
MSRRAAIVITALLVVCLFLLVTPIDEVISQEIRRVLVMNFPDVQTVRGTVSISGPVHFAELASFEGIVVPPVRPTETTRLVEAGTLDAEGFASVVLSLQGITKGDVKQPGTVGVILIPDQQQVQEAFDELGLMLFSLDAAAGGVSRDTPYFGSAQPRYTVAFPQYKMYLYNTTDKTVTVNIYAYLTV